MKQNQSNLYQDRFEHDACGIGAVVSIDGIQEHKVLDDALTIVEKLEHRAGKDATGQVGDGVGILTQISHSFFKKAASSLGISLGKAGDYGVGMFFFPQDTLKRNFSRKMFEVILQKTACIYLAGERFLSIRKSWEIMQERECPISHSVLLSARKTARPDCLSTAFYTLRDGNLNKAVRIPMWLLYPPGQSYIRACSL